jgi:polysaccharide biosynthesis transport protein
LSERNDDLIGRSASLPRDKGLSFDLDDEVSLRDLAIVPLKRKRIVIFCTILGLLAAILITLIMTPRYRATATIELNENKESGVSALSDLAAEATGGADELKVKIQTETEVIQDDTIALAVMKKLGMLRLAKSGWLNKREGPVVSLDDLPAKRREGLLQQFESHMKVEQVKNSRLLAITYTSKDPVQAATVANEIVAEYKNFLLSSNFSSSKEVSQWLGSQLSDLSDRVTTSEKAVADFERTHNLASSMLGLASLTEGSSGAAAAASGSGGGGSGAAGGGGGTVQIQELDRLTNLNEEVTQAQALQLEDEAIYRLTATQNPDVISSLGSSSLPGLANSSVITQGNGLGVLDNLREQESAIKVEYADAATKYGAKNPNLIEISNQLQAVETQIREEMERIKQRAKNDLTLAQQNEQALKSAYKAQEDVTSKMNDDILQLGVLLEQERSSRELYDVLYAKLQEANIDSGSSATNVTIADPARPPGTPWMPKPFLFAIAGLWGGVFMGIGLAYLLESQDDTVTDSFEVEALTNLPVLGQIPFHKTGTKPQADGALTRETSPFLLAPEGATAESLRSLRSGLLLSGVGKRLRVISFTSALEAEGKSYTVYNLAISFAATGRKVLVIDADLRRSKQHLLFRIPQQTGLVDILAGMASFDEWIVPHPVQPNLFLLSAGHPSPLATEILGNGDMSKVLDAARSQFEIVLVDNAPVLPVSDAIIVSTYCDGVIGLVRARRTSQKALRRFVQALARNGVHILGLVIEAVDISATEYRSVYGYNVQSYYHEK